MIPESTSPSPGLAEKGVNEYSLLTREVFTDTANESTARSCPLDPLEVDLLLNPDKRRLSVEDHLSWRQRLAMAGSPPLDEIDRLVAEGGGDD